MKHYLNSKRKILYPTFYKTDSSYTKRSGFSLIELVIASGIGVTIMLGISSALVTQAMVASRLEDKVSVIDLQRTLTYALSNRDICTSTILGASLSIFDPMAIPSSLSIVDIPYSSPPTSLKIVTSDSNLQDSQRVLVTNIDRY